MKAFEFIAYKGTESEMIISLKAAGKKAAEKYLRSRKKYPKGALEFLGQISLAELQKRGGL